MCERSVYGAGIPEKKYTQRSHDFSLLSLLSWCSLNILCVTDLFALDPSKAKMHAIYRSLSVFLFLFLSLSLSLVLGKLKTKYEPTM